MTRLLVAALFLLTATASPQGQSGSRRLTTIDAIRQFTSFYHLQPVLLRGEIEVDGLRTVLRADQSDLRVQVDDGVGAPSGTLEVRGLLIDIGRLEPGDPRAGNAREPSDWPRPGEELLLRVESATEVSLISSAPTIRSIALEPWRYVGDTVTLVGSFRGRNLFGDLAGSPGNSRYDFVLRGTEGAVWVTGMRPRGRDLDLDVDRRADTGQWVEVTGTVVHERGLVSISAARVARASEPVRDDEPSHAEVPRAPLPPVDVVFSMPTDRDIDVSPGAPLRVQFSRGLAEASLEGRTRVSYLGQDSGVAGLPHTTSYDAANRSIQVTPTDPFEPFRTVRLELLEGVTSFDGAPVTPWTLTFSVGP